MKNFVQEGELLPVTAAAAIVAGEVVAVGGLIGVARSKAAIGEQVTVKRRGVFNNMPKTTGTAWAYGDKLYWNSSTNKFTTAASGNALVGLAAAAADSADATGSVLLTGQIG